MLGRAFFILFSAGALFAAPASAQIHPQFDPQDTVGLLGEDALDPQIAGTIPGMSLTRAYIPDQIDLSPLMPPPVQQIAGSCVAFSVGYATRGYYNNLRGSAADDDDLPSPAHLHARIRSREPGTPCKVAGSHPVLALLALRDGAVDRASVPDDAICNGADLYPGPLEADFRTAGENVIFLQARDGAVTQRHLDIIKQELAAGHPVITSMQLYRRPEAPSVGAAPSALAYLGENEVFGGSLEPHGPTVGRHAMVAVGFDERRRAFLIQNSWGPFWAGNGRGWVSYDAMLADMVTAVSMRTGVTPPRPVPGLADDQQNRISADRMGVSGCSELVVTREIRNQVYVSGFVDKQSDLDELRRKAAFDVSDVAVRPWPVCEAMKTLSAPRTSPLAPQVRMLEGTTDLTFGDSLAFEVVMPDVPAFLYLVYIDAKGTAVNLLPRNGPLREQRAPGERLIFGDGGPGRLTFTASPPVGDEAIIAIASRSPLMALEELETGEMLFRMPALTGATPTGSGTQTAQARLVLTPLSRSVTADDRYYLSQLRKALAERPDMSALPREVGANVLHLRVEAR